MLRISCLGFALALASCTALSSPEAALRTASAGYGAPATVALPLIRMNVAVREGAKTRSLFLSGQAVAEWPDKLRLKLTKADIHLVTLVVNGHAAALHFPRTSKALDVELNRPVLGGETADPLAAALEMTLILVQGPFPLHPLGAYTLEGEVKGVYTYAAPIQGGTLRLAVDGRTGAVRSRTCRFAGREEWAIGVAFDQYETMGDHRFPRKFTLTACKGTDPLPAVTVEIYLAQVNFNRPAPAAAFRAAWPEGTVKLAELPAKLEELFGTIEETPGSADGPGEALKPNL
ncbi:MAG: hypothetical protein ABIF71_08015 [Planctomycetota bacterium]